MSRARHALLLGGIGVAAGAVVVNTFCLLRLALHLMVAGGAGQRNLWPEPRRLTVWTGVDWFTVTVMPVAFGRWGVAVCRDDTPRRGEPLELIGRARTEREARRLALALTGQVLAQRAVDRVAVLATQGRS